MADDDTIDDSDEHDGSDHGYSASAADPVLIALELCRIASSPKTIATALKRLRKLDRQFADIQAKCAALEARAEQTAAALAERETAIAAREVALDAREAEFAASIEEARDHLRSYYDSIAAADRITRYRILNSASLLSNFNPQLQDLPDWPALRRLVVNLPPDPPPLEREVAAPRIDAMSDVSDDPNADRHGNVFLGTLSRDVSHKGAA
jgi:hypothetical protein